MRALTQRTAAEPLRGVALAGTTLLHAAVLGFAVLASHRGSARRPLPPAYRVELVAAPRATAPEAATTPAAAPAREPAARPAPDTRRSPAPPARTAAPALRTASAVPRTSALATPTAPVSAPAAAAPGPPAAGGATGAPEGIGVDPATIRTEGVEFPFPGYLRNLVAQVYRRWRPPSGNAELEAEVLFIVQRDGSIRNLRFVRRSGSFAFDLEAQGSVEAAARAGAFGPLPEGYGADVLPVSFFFSPRAVR